MIHPHPLAAPSWPLFAAPGAHLYQNFHYFPVLKIWQTIHHFLAIVKKIMEDHGGVLKLRDRAGGGAIVQLRFPERESPAEDAPGAMMTKT